MREILQLVRYLKRQVTQNDVTDESHCRSCFHHQNGMFASGCTYILDELKQQAVFLPAQKSSSSPLSEWGGGWLETVMC